MQRVLVTGGTGFLGSNILSRLIDHDDVESIVVPTTKIRGTTSLDLLNIVSDKVSLIKGDIRDYDFLQCVFNEYEFDTVFHLGAMAEVRKCQTNARLAFETNVMGTVNLLEVARLYSSVDAIVVSSSDKAYGSCSLPYKEDQPLSGNGIYEVTKSCTDLIARSYYYNHGLPVSVSRCCNLYGGNDTNISRIVPNTIRLLLNDKSPIIWKGSEKSIREFLYIEDAVDAYLTIVDNIELTKGQAYNIGSGSKVTIENLVESIIEAFDTDIQIKYVEKDFPEITHQYLDSSKIFRDTGWKPKVSLPDGLKFSIDACKNRYIITRKGQL